MSLSIATAADAVRVLSAVRHRGAYHWVYDAGTRRVQPMVWNEQEAPPCFTLFEAVTIARQLVAMGAHATA